MPPSMQKLVRPFVGGDVAPPRQIFPTGIDALGVLGQTLTITVGGAPSIGDQVVIVFSSSAIPNSPRTISYTAVGGDFLPQIALGLLAAFNADSNLAAAGLLGQIQPGSPASVEITQPVDLNPQATMIGQVVGTTTLSFTSDLLILKIGFGNAGGKTFSKSTSSSITVYNKKMPVEQTR